MRSKYEIKAQKDLQKEGWLVDWKVRPRFGGNGYATDLFGLFDLVAIKEGEPMRWISIKGTVGLLTKLKTEIETFWMPDGNQKELWCRSKANKHRIIWNKWICP